MADIIKRPRRLRMNPVLRKMVSETSVLPHQLVYPLFVKEGISEKCPVPSMPGVCQFSFAEAVAEAVECRDLGISSVLVFGIPSKKDARASGAYDKNGIVQKVVRAIKDKCPDLVVATDVCLCEYMDHGHCGIVGKDGKIENDPTLELLTKTALSHAEAGADIVAPSDMMDGRVGAIRARLDESGFCDTPIMSYAVKYASAFYGPFRDAAESAPSFGDRKTYQMDCSNSREALREAGLDEEEGADILVVKPALLCLDIISKISARTNLPVAAYQVSGEYSMICLAAEKGCIDKKQAMAESLTAIRRAGATLVITYFAKEFARNGI